MKVLVTGGTGFIGRHALAPLLAAGCEVHVIGRQPCVDPGVTTHAGSLHDRSFVRDVLGSVRPSHLLHLAWYTEHGRFWSSPENLRWLATSLDLLQEFVEAGGRRVVIAGTCAEFSLTSGKISEEHTPRAPFTLYGASKAALRDVASAFSRERGFSFAWGYVFFLYGPHEHPQRLVPSVIRAVLRGDEARCTAGTQVRDFLHASDAGAAFAALLLSRVEGGVNIASGQSVTVGEVAMQAASIAGGAGLLRLGAIPMSPSDPPVIVADTTRLSEEVGWRPHITLDAGLRDVVEWWRNQMGANGHG